MPDPTNVNETRQELKAFKGPSGFGSVVDEERVLASADAGVTAAGWSAGPTGVTGATGMGITGATGPAGP